MPPFYRGCGRLRYGVDGGAPLPCRGDSQTKLECGGAGIPSSTRCDQNQPWVRSGGRGNGHCDTEAACSVSL
jgi:hypothetical protein